MPRGGHLIITLFYILASTFQKQPRTRQIPAIVGYHGLMLIDESLIACTARRLELDECYRLRLQAGFHDEPHYVMTARRLCAAWPSAWAFNILCRSISTKDMISRLLFIMR